MIEVEVKAKINSFDEMRKKLDEINAEKVILLGNSELRTPENIPYITSFACGDGFAAEGISIIAINTPDGKITPADRQRITASPKNSVIVLHHYLSSLEKDSDDFIKSWAEQSEGLILQAHSHRPFDYYIGSTHVVGLNTMDPEKAIETPPGYNILRIDGDKYELSDRFMPLKLNNLEDFRDLLGVSCANNEECLDYAIEHKIKCIEIRKPEFEEERIEYILEKVAKWRAVGGKVLSIHMTDIKYDGNEFTGVENWNKCIDLAKRLNVDTMTVHVPRVKVKYMEKGGKIWNKYE